MSRCYLLELPPELRNSIFELTVISPQPFPAQLLQRSLIRILSPGTKWISKVLPEVPEIARTSRQIRDEVLPVFYNSNTFAINQNDFPISRGVMLWWSRFAKGEAPKHIANVEYAFKWRNREEYSRSVIRVHRNAAREVQVAVQGDAEQACLCYAMGRLRKVAAATEGSAAVERAQRGISKVLYALVGTIIVDLIKVLEMRSSFIDESDDDAEEADFEGIPVCEECSKPRWRTDAELAMPGNLVHHMNINSSTKSSNIMARCRLLELPAELRNRIFELAITTPIPLQANPPITANSSSPTTSSSAQPALARTNRLIREEVLPVFYHGNTFVMQHKWLGDLNGVMSWWQRLATKELRRHIKKLHYAFQGSQPSGYASIGVDLQLSSVEVCLTDAGELEYSFRGGVEKICVCDAQDCLRRVTATKSREGGDGDDLRYGIGRVIVLLAVKVVPELIEVLRAREAYIYLHGLERRFFRGCARCDKPRLIDFGRRR
ncbi:hypothetical protein LTR17_017040 [Elasticomyces elasticus]|nr:hypothetical protein LTR17_017040 [Elasticomyces elasticus]